MWLFKRKKVYADVEVIEPKKLSLSPLVSLELKRLANQNLSIRSKCMAIHSVLKRYKECGYEIYIKH